MAFSDWSTTAASNTTVGGVSIAEGCDMANLNNGIRNVMADAKAALAPAVVGLVADYAGTTAPDGWLLCYGQAISRTTYAALLDVIGTTFGVGDGTTTFNVPDLRGRVIAGQDDMGGSSADRLTGLSGGVNGDTLGAAGGEEAHILTEAELAEHLHNSSASFYQSDTAANVGYKLATNASTFAFNTTATAGSDDPHNNVQPTLVLNKIIYAGA